MIEKSKFYTIIFLILMMSGISMLLTRSYYQKKPDSTTLLNDFMIEVIMMYTIETITSQTEKRYDYLLKVAPDHMRHRISSLRTISQPIEGKIVEVREELISQSGGIRSENGTLVNGEKKVQTLSTFIAANATEILRGELRDYLHQLNALSSTTLEVKRYFPSPSEIKKSSSNEFLSIYPKKWLKGTTYSDSFINDLTVQQYLTQNTAIQLNMKLAELAALKYMEGQLLEEGYIIKY